MRTLAVPVELFAGWINRLESHEDPAKVACDMQESLSALLEAPGVDGKPHPLMDCPACGKLRGLDHACETPAPEER